MHNHILAIQALATHSPGAVSTFSDPMKNFRFAFFAVTFLLCSFASAADFKSGKLIDVQDATQVGSATLANSTVSGEKATTAMGAMVPRCELTVALEGEQYSAVYPLDKHLKIQNLNQGDEVMVRIEGNKMVLKSPTDGKELKSKIVRRVAADKKTGE